MYGVHIFLMIFPSGMQMYAWSTYICGLNGEQLSTEKKMEKQNFTRQEVIGNIHEQ
jgi:hypothetical protein